MTCSDTAWHTLWTLVNGGRGDRVNVSRTCLTELFECIGRVPDDVVLKAHRNTMDCDRAKLMAVLKEHGSTCGRA